MLIALALFFTSRSSLAQGTVIANTYPRAIRPSESVTSVPQAAFDSARSALGVATLTQAQVAEVSQKYRRSRRLPFVNWNSLAKEGDAAQFWGMEPVTLLPTASVSPGGNETSLFTELAAALSGGWRFSLSTALAVSTTKAEDKASAAADSTQSSADVGFRRFLAGGGNIALAGARPVGIANQGSGTHLLLFVPRIWANVPTLSDAEGIRDFGGEAAVEYQYQRYERKWDGDALGDRAPAPFLTFHTRFATAAGTHSFYRTIGRDGFSLLPYVVPSLDLNFANGVKLGASYFYAFGSLKEHEGLRFHVALAPPSEKKNNARQ